MYTCRNPGWPSVPDATSHMASYNTPSAVSSDCANLAARLWQGSQAILSRLARWIEHELEAGRRTLLHLCCVGIAFDHLRKSIDESHLMASLRLRLAKDELNGGLLDRTGTQHQLKGLA